MKLGDNFINYGIFEEQSNIYNNILYIEQFLTTQKIKFSRYEAAIKYFNKWQMVDIDFILLREYLYEYLFSKLVEVCPEDCVFGINNGIVGFWLI